jgi:hypothetical protein
MLCITASRIEAAAQLKQEQEKALRIVTIE